MGGSGVRRAVEIARRRICPAAPHILPDSDVARYGPAAGGPKDEDAGRPDKRRNGLKRWSCEGRPSPSWLLQALLEARSVGGDKGAELLGARQRDEVTGDEEFLAETGGSVFDLGLVLVTAEHDADRRLVTVSHHVLLEIIQVEVHLPGVGVGEGADFQVNQHMAAEPPVVKHEVDAIVLVADGDAELARLETKTGADFEEESLDMIEECGLEIVLRVGSSIGESREFEHVRIADEILDGRGRFGGLLPRPGDDGAFVFRETGALVEETADLTLELALRSSAEEALVFVEGSLPWIVDAQELDQLGPGEL